MAMNTTMQRGSRPLAVNVALVLLLLSFGESLTPRLVRAEWSNVLVCIKYGSMLAMLFVPLWFIFRGKNWARWLLVAFALAGFCFSLPFRIRLFQDGPVSSVVVYCVRNIIIWVALGALFLPSSSQWFRGNRNAILA
jgi:hypothetical protein